MTRLSERPTGIYGRQGLLVAAGLTSLVLALLIVVLSADSSITTPATRRLFGLWRIRHVAPAIFLIVVGTGLLLAAGPRHRLLAYLSAILSTFTTLGALEIVGATGMVQWNSLLASRSGELGSLGTQAVPYLDIAGVTYQDTAMVWGLSSEPIRFRYRTDRYGFRNQVDRPQDEIDIFLLGDSILVSALVPSEESLAAVLEKLIRQRVMQVALIGISPQEEHDLYRQAGFDPKGKRIMQFIFEGNDLSDSLHYASKKENGGQEPRRGNSLIRYLWDRLTAATDHPSTLNGRRFCEIDKTTYTFLWAKNSFEGIEEQAQTVMRSLEDFSQEIKAAGGQYMVVFVPTKLRVLKGLCNFPPEGEIRDPEEHIGPLRGHMNDWASRSGVPVLDLTEPLALAAEDGRIPWFWGDTHMNETGLAVSAQAISDWLARMDENRKQSL